MIKQVILLLVLTAGMVIGMMYAQHGVTWLITAHQWVSTVLSDVFTGGEAGNFIKGFIALLALPLLIALIPTIIYWILRRHWFPYFMEIVWVVWLIQAGALLAKASGA